MKTSAVFLKLSKLIHPFWYKTKIIIAPRGELGSGALIFNSPRKKIYLFLMRRFLEKNIVWHATSTEEENDIKKIIGARANIFTLANIALTDLICEVNLLTSLDVTQNTALTVLDFDDNLLTSIDVTQNTALIYLWCGANQLTSLDVSQNPNLTWLSCYDNLLTCLNVKNGNKNNPKLSIKR